MRIETILLRPGDPRRAEILGRLRDPVLAEQMWADAEHTPPPPADDGRTWAVITVDGEPAAWVAAQVSVRDGLVRPQLVVTDGYERRGPGRAMRLYPAAYGCLHGAVVLPAAREGIGAVTYVYRQQVHLLERWGWQRTGITDVSGCGHRWWELRRPAGGVHPIR